MTSDEGSGGNISIMVALLFSFGIYHSVRLLLDCVPLPGLIIPFLYPGPFLTVTSG